MTVLTTPKIILYSATRKENSKNSISNFEKCIFLHILIQIATISMYSRTSLARTSLSQTYPYVEVFSRSRSHCSLFQYNSTSIGRIYISKFIHTSNDFQSPITIVRTYSHIFNLKLICKGRCLRSIRFSHLSTCQLR